MFILLIDVDDDTRSVVFNDLSLHDSEFGIFQRSDDYLYLSHGVSLWSKPFLAKV